LLPLLVRRPPVKAATLDPPVECPPRHRTAVSAIQSVPSHAVIPIPAEDESQLKPNPAPCIVTSEDPVLAMFTRSTMHTLCALMETARLMLPTTEPVLTTNRRVPFRPAPTRHRTALSDSQLDASQLVRLTRSWPVRDSEPIPIPCNVTLTEPLGGVFARRGRLIRPEMMDEASVILPDNTPAVRDSRRVPNTPDPLLQLTQESDCQSLASHLLPPSLPTPLYIIMPSPAPYTVTLDDPEAARFAAKAILTLADGPDTACVSDPVDRVNVTPSTLLPP